MIRPMRVSIVVPVLDEAAGIVATLDALAPLRASGHEVIVVDGGSRDATVALARPRSDRVVTTRRGRAAQMNAGAALATGDAILFLHADTRLPPGAAGAMAGALGRGRRWGRFDVAIEGRSRWLPLVAFLMNLRSRLSGIVTGDQGIFVDRALFAAAGGYAPIPLMEDIELSRRLKRLAGRPAALRDRVRTSGRRWDADGAWSTIALMWRLRAAYSLGADPATLARRYAPSRRPRVLQLFAKAPVPGAVKTRLARTLGAGPAVEAYRALVDRTVETAARARREGVVDAVELWCAPDSRHPAFAGWAKRCGATIRVQSGADLGARMAVALDDAIARGRVPILVGTDCPALDVGYLDSASAALEATDAVIGPSEDGGYVLIGLARPVAAFDGIAWSTPEVLAQTRAALAREGVRWRELDPLWDVDTEADFERWRGSPVTPA
ncbi:MAG: TIGR04283 family arsenosugar biosynthesis glycosyltransferase [Burkholderiales bacterium]|nr:TIGR04283 family arsenosugar biosynthesis glycosyltransferase [Burkholderiales bacterium]